MTQASEDLAKLERALSKADELRDTASALVTCLRMVRRRQKRSRDELENDPAHKLGDAALLAAGQLLCRPRSSRVVQFASSRGGSFEGRSARSVVPGPAASSPDEAVLAAGGFDRPRDETCGPAPATGAAPAAARASSASFTSSSSSSSSGSSSPDQGPARGQVVVPSILPRHLRQAAAPPATPSAAHHARTGGQRSDSTACTLTQLKSPPQASPASSGPEARPATSLGAAPQAWHAPPQPRRLPPSSAPVAWFQVPGPFAPHSRPFYGHRGYVPPAFAPLNPAPHFAGRQAPLCAPGPAYAAPPAKRAHVSPPSWTAPGPPGAWLPSAGPVLAPLGAATGANYPRSDQCRANAVAEVERRLREDAAQRTRQRSIGPGGKKWVKGRMSEAELRAVDAFVESIESGHLRVRKGDLAREMRQAVNAARPPEFFEKLVSRRRLNDRLSSVLAPRASRKAKREATAGVSALAAAVEALEAREAAQVTA